MNLIFYSLLIALFWGISPIAHKKLLNNMDTKFVLIASGLFYSLFLILYSIYYWSYFKQEYKQVEYKYLLYLAGIAFMLSFIPNIIYFFLLKQHDSSIVSALVNSAPVFTVLVSFLILGEKIHKYELIGIFFIIIGIIAISLRH
jgi:drug/metabolite transporter (DMT)-like permease